MSDALSRNVPKDHVVVEANCTAHARRGIVDQFPNFPVECRTVLLFLREVCAVEADCKSRKLTADKRLAEHRDHSEPTVRQEKPRPSTPTRCSSCLGQCSILLLALSATRHPHGATRSPGSWDRGGGSRQLSLTQGGSHEDAGMRGMDRRHRCRIPTCTRSASAKAHQTRSSARAGARRGGRRNESSERVGRLGTRALSSLSRTGWFVARDAGPERTDARCAGLVGCQP